MLGRERKPPRLPSFAGKVAYILNPVCEEARRTKDERNVSNIEYRHIHIYTYTAQAMAAILPPIPSLVFSILEPIST